MAAYRRIIASDPSLERRTKILNPFHNMCRVISIDAVDSYLASLDVFTAVRVAGP